MTDAVRWVWGTTLCRRCGLTSVTVIEEVETVSRLAGIECRKCGGRRARFTFRGGVHATEDAALTAAEHWVTTSIQPPKPA